MNTSLKVTKYQLFDYKLGLIIFYSIIAIISVIIITSNVTSDGNMSGIGLSTVIFIFIVGLNSFKVVFKFMQVNNVSRKSFLMGSIQAFLIVAFFMTIIDFLLGSFLKNLFLYISLYELIYMEKSVLKEIIWSFLLYSLAINLGFMITIIYYRVNKLFRTIISVLPIFAVLLIILMNTVTNGFILKSLNKFILFLTNPISSMICLFIGIIVILSCSYLLTRRAVVKE
ncbi:MAG: putative rane protein [Haloplasmataceae bacterium]|nr:putative rane protein [Haloplasmataceae bacterium]